MTYTPNSTPTANAVFYRSYSRKDGQGNRETWEQATERTVNAIAEIGNFTENERQICIDQMLAQTAMVSGRWLWVGGTEWVENSKNFYGAYNCSNILVESWDDFRLLMNLAMQGCGTGALLEDKFISKLPPITNTLDLNVIGKPGDADFELEETVVKLFDNKYLITVGDSREGWCEAYKRLMFIASSQHPNNIVAVNVDISHVREAGKKLKGFGGTANPIRLGEMFERVAKVINRAVGRQLTATECCLIIDEAAACVVAGNIRRCLPHFTRVTMADGMFKSISEIMIGDLVKTPLGSQKVTDVFEQGVQQCYQITCQNGNLVQATENHRFGFYSRDDNSFGWVHVKDVKPGYRIITQSGNFQTVSSVIKTDEFQTFDIEVENEHCFYAEGFLSHNSAGIKQADKDDQEFANCKDNLWQQDSNGNWRIDPDRDALRMSNHTRVYHNKPSFEEIKAAVTKQFYSGEGAIQYAPEAIARANADVITNKFLRRLFIRQYEKGYGEEFFRKRIPGITERELDHRMTRYGLNPCLVAGTMVLTREGHFPIEELVGKTVQIHDGNVWVEIDNFRVTAENQDVYTVTTCGGEKITATAYHTFILENGERVQLKDLKVGQRLLTHDLRIHGLHHEKAAYLKGFLIGDGTIRNGVTALDLYTPKYMCIDRLIESRNEIESKVPVCVGDRYSQDDYVGFNEELNQRKMMRGFAGSQEDFIPWVSDNRQNFPMEVLNWDLPSKLEFIAGVMDADGTVMDSANAYGYQISSIHQNWLLGFQTLLHTVGVNSSIQLNRKEGFSDFGTQRGGRYKSKNCYRLTIAQKGSILLSQQCIFTRLKSFSDRVVKNKSKTGNNKIKSIEFSHNADKVYCCTVITNNQFSLSSSIVVGQCAEILLNNNTCNLADVHLNRIHPEDQEGQIKAFMTAGLFVCALLHHKFVDEKMQYSREIDPIVGASFTGLFDFFVKAFGIRWLKWWEAGRPLTEEGKQFKKAEKKYLILWREVVKTTVETYCKREGLKIPNRYTTMPPAGSKSLLTGASPGWHCPKAARYIRRITFAKNDPVALAYMDLGYSIVPSQSDKDENGVLLNDPFDSRCTEWLVEIPYEMSWANIPGVDDIDINQFSATAQFDFYMQVQKHYSTHTTSATIEFREDEIDPLSSAIFNNIYQSDGYISAALLPRSDAPYPRLPFEKIDKETYERLQSEVLARRKTDDFHSALMSHDNPESLPEGSSGCDSDKCFLPLTKPE